MGDRLGILGAVNLLPFGPEPYLLVYLVTTA